MPGDISCFCCRLLPFSKINFLKISFRNTFPVSNGKDPGQDRHSVGHDLGPNLGPKQLAETKVAATCSLKRVKEKKIDKIDKYKTIFTFFKFLHLTVFTSLQIFSHVFTAHALSFKRTIRNLLTEATD